MLLLWILVLQEIRLEPAEEEVLESKSVSLLTFLYFFTASLWRPLHVSSCSQKAECCWNGGHADNKRSEGCHGNSWEETCHECFLSSSFALSVLILNLNIVNILQILSSSVYIGLWLRRSVISCDIFHKDWLVSMGKTAEAMMQHAYYISLSSLISSVVASQCVCGN